MGLAKPDCYDLIFGNMGPEVLNWVVQKPTFDINDYFYFAQVDADPGNLFVSANSPLQTIDDIVAEGKKRTLNVGVSRLAHPATLVERRLVATARSYVVSPGALGPAASDPEQATDRLSASYLVALAARAVREVAGLARRARAEGKRLATLSLDAEVRFASPADRAAFTEELSEAVTRLVARYHDESAEDGRAHRLVVLAHPTPAETP